MRRRHAARPRRCHRPIGKLGAFTRAGDVLLSTAASGPKHGKFGRSNMCSRIDPRRCARYL